MSLSVVIPVWNDPSGLQRLLLQVCEMGVFDQIIVSDDASSPPSSPQTIGLSEEQAASLAADPRVLWLYSETQRGAGHARNLALEHITSDHVIFFDSDDLFLPEFAELVPELAGLDFDFCIFRHVDSRVRAGGGLAPLAPDEALWEKSQAKTASPTLLDMAGVTQLCRISAYPWNKIYRTAFLREENIRCTEIPVHNDLELHWMSFLKARRILTSKRLGCEHFVVHDGQRLTNRSGLERFQVFKALDALHDALDTSPRRMDFLEPFAEFYSRLFGWIGDILEPELRDDFSALARDYLYKRMSVPLYTLIVLRNPSIGTRINSVLSAAAK